MDVEAEPEHVLNGTAAVTYVIVLAIVIVIAVLAYTTGRSWSVRRRALIRLYAADDPRPAGAGSSPRETALARWLARAGYRRPNAQSIFVAATIGFVAIGVALSQVYRLILFGPLLDAVVNVP